MPKTRNLSSPVVRKKNRRNTVFKRRATRLEQGSTHPLYQFALTGEELLEIADISRISREDAGKLLGYQRPEVRKHVADIVEYLNSDDVLFPHALIVAFSSRVKFTSSRGPGVNDGVSTSGFINIPLPRGEHSKPGWIVDGQQRALAISKSKRPSLPIPICAFIADDVAVQRDQFLRINNAKPLPRGLVTELLPEVSAPISASTAPSRLPSALCNSLNTDASSPFQGLIKRTSTSKVARGHTVISDGPLVRVLRDSLCSPAGCLFPYRDVSTGDTDVDTIWKIIITFWTAVKNSFPDAWGKPPTESRLMHGVGLSAVGRLMDRIMAHVSVSNGHAVAAVERELALIKPICRWTSGRWEDLNEIEWNQLENTSRHIRALSSLLVRAYVDAKSKS